MSVSSVPSSTDPTSSASSAASAADATAQVPPNPEGSLGEGDFLTLLTAELQNQDPDSPMDDTQLASQLAQFSSVEQLTDVNTNLQSLQEGQASDSQVNDAALIGKEVTYNSDSVSLVQGTPVNLVGSLANPAADVKATITNANGQVVATVDLGAEPHGQFSVPWNGLDNQGNALPSGTYSVQISATDSQNNAITVTQEAQSQITGVTYVNGYPQLVVSTGDIDLSNVDEIDQA